MAMHRDDLISMTLLFVRGYIEDYLQRVPNAGVPNKNQYILDVHGTCWRYLNGQLLNGLDGTCSDLVCDVALKMKRLFEPHLEGYADPQNFDISAARIMEAAERKYGEDVVVSDPYWVDGQRVRVGIVLPNDVALGANFDYRTGNFL